MHPAREALRRATQDWHLRVDRAFSRFDLTDADAYVGFLRAHATVLEGAETMIGAADLWPGWVPRAAALRADLEELDAPPPRAADPAPRALRDRAALWGVLYVLEGSRLGGGVLAGQVPPGLPRRYLESRHPPGAWARFQEALAAASPPSDTAWTRKSITGARWTFRAFERSANSS